MKQNWKNAKFGNCFSARRLIKAKPAQIVPVYEFLRILLWHVRDFDLLCLRNQARLQEETTLMTTAFTLPTAKIYQFTPRQRELSAAPAGTAKLFDIRPAPAPAVVIASAWYHEAAMREENPARKG